jgi:transcriptional regulator with XRE-family HTH domain
MAQVELGERIATLREDQALTQAELAERARISPSTLSQIESGRVPRPHVGTIRKIARALNVEPQDLRRAEDPALAGKAEAPYPGPSLLEKALDAASHDEEKDSQAIARLLASEGTPQLTHSYEEDEFRAELRTHGFPDEYFEGFIWPIIVKAMQADRLEQELAQLREDHERETAQSSNLEAIYEEATEEFDQRYYGFSQIAQDWNQLSEYWTRRLEEGDVDQKALRDLVVTLENVATGMERNVADERKELVARYGAEAAPDMSLLRPSINKLGLLVGQILKEAEEAGVSSETRDNLVDLAGHFQKEAS